MFNFLRISHNINVASLLAVSMAISGCVGSNSFSKVMSVSFLENGSAKSENELLSTAQYRQFQASGIGANLALPDNGMVKIPIRISVAPKAGEVFTVSYEFESDTLSEGDNFVVMSTKTLTFREGEREKYIVLMIADDDIYVGPRTITVILSPGRGLNPGRVARHTVVIEDDELPPKISFAKARVEVKEKNKGESTRVDLELSLTSISSEDLKYPLRLELRGAVPGADFQIDERALANFVFPKFAKKATVSFTIIGNDIHDRDRGFVLVPAAASALTGENSFSEVVIKDDELEPTLVFVADRSNSNEPALAGAESTVVIPVRLSHESKFPVSASVLVAQGGTTAVAGSDYRFTQPTLQFAAGQTTANVSVVLLGDGAADAVEKRIQLSAVPGNRTHLLTITDAQGPPQVKFNVSAVSVEEGGSQTVRVSLFPAAGFIVKLGLNPVRGSADTSDYSLSKTELTFAALQTEGEFSIGGRSDTVFEGEEQFSINLNITQGNAIIPAGGQSLTVTIVDKTPMPIISLGDLGTDVTELPGENTLALPIRIINGVTSSKPITVTYANKGTSSKPATPRIDYSLPGETLSIPALSAAASVQLKILPDSIYEGDEKFEVSLTGVSGATLSGSNIQREFTIKDRQSKPFLTFTPADLTLKEGDRLTVRAILSSGAAGSINIPLSTAQISGVSLATNDDYSFTVNGNVWNPSGGLNFPAGTAELSLNLTAVADLNLEEPLEAVRLSQGNMTHTYANGLVENLDKGTNVLDLKISNNLPMPTLEFVKSEIEIYEDDYEGLIGIISSLSPENEISVGFSVQDDTAKRGTDFSVPLSELITANSVKIKRQTVIGKAVSTGIPVSPIIDSINDRVRKFRVQLHAGNGYTLGAKISAVVSILDRPVICDPLSEKQYYGNQNVGLKGKVYYSNRITGGGDINSEIFWGTDDGFNNISDIENPSRSPGVREVNGVLFLARVFVPSRLFNRGFTKEGNYEIKHFYNPSKFSKLGLDLNTLDESKLTEQQRKNLIINEFFQIKVESDFVLPPGRTAGYYTFGAIVDDGLLIRIKDTTTGEYLEVGMNEGGPPRFGAARSDDAGQKRVRRFYMEPGKTYTFEMNYFQAPAMTVAHVLLVKKVATATTDIGITNRNDGSDDLFFIRREIDPVTGFQKEGPGMRDLRADNWDFISPEFFKVRGGINPCMARRPADIIRSSGGAPLTATEIQKKIATDLIKVNP